MLNQFKALPRESRDTLFLLAVIGWVVLPLTPHLPLWCTLGVAAILVWRGWLAWHSRSLPNQWWVVGVLGVTVVATLAEHRTVLGRDAGVTLTVVLLALKTLELRARRDAFVIFFLAFFVMLANFFFSQSLLTAVAILIGLFGLLTALVNAHMPVGRPPLLQAARTAGWMTLLGAPIMAVMFVLFPRLAPLWGVPGDAMAGKSGLSSSMEVGSIASLALDETIVMRLRFEGNPPPQRDLYFRGPVLGAFDGRQWQPLTGRTAERFQVPASLEVTGQSYRYQVTMEASRRPWLFVLEATPGFPRVPGYELAMTQDLQWTTNRIVGDLVRYQAESFPQFRHGPRRYVTGLGQYIYLPDGFDPRTRALAKEIANSAGPDVQSRVDAVMQRLRTGGYSYTLEPGIYGTNTADEFWFDRKEGFCEHIASAFVILMRAMDVPARVVTGYQGGEVNNVDGFLTIRQSDAHAWAEVWSLERGWTRVDPTSAVAPGRTGTVQRLRPTPSVFSSAVEAVSPGFVTQMRSLRATWEAVNNSWNQWVLNYTQSRQLDILRSLGMESPGWEDLVYLLIGLVLAATLGGMAWTLYDRNRHDPWLRLLWRAQAVLKRAGLQAPATSPPRTLAALAVGRFGAEANAARDWLLKLEALRYAPEASRGATVAALRREFRRIAWPAHNDKNFPHLERSLCCTLNCCRSHRLGWPDARIGCRDRRCIDIAIRLALCAPTTAKKRKPAIKPKSAAKASPAKGASASTAARTPRNAVAYATRPEVMAFADDVAARRDLDRGWVRETLGNARFLPNVPRLMLPPPPGTPKNWRVYRSRFIDPIRIGAGARFWRENMQTLQRAEAEYGVPAEIIVGIIGVETIYGQQMGTFRVIDALATLAFDFPLAHPRAQQRIEFFRGELEQFLSLQSRSGEDPMAPLGSYAGAMGMPQFMPSSWAKFAVDFDGDGRIDLRASAADTIGSVANYFKAFGWKTGMPTHYPVRFDAATLNMDALMAPDILPTFGVESFAAKGAILEGDARAHAGQLALIELQNGAEAPSYVAGTENFYVITRYNWSSYYAMAVIELGREVTQALGR